MYIYKLFPNKYTIPKRNLEIKFIQKLYYSGKFQMFYHKAAVWGALVFKPRLLGLYAPLRIPSKRNAGKAMLHMAFCW
jgi:hypothetical protein